MAMHYAGFEVIVFEKVREFLRLGDSLGLGENALKLLKRWGLYEELIAIGNKNPVMNIRRWDNGQIMATQPLMVGVSFSSSYNGWIERLICVELTRIWRATSDTEGITTSLSSIA
jgi:2-polyprenyl-6-methoxyphenol hydroxylase-like FAD-dependent oxidoreductase